MVLIGSDCYLFIEEDLSNHFLGKRVLVFGGSRGIGAAIVTAFVEAGATVVFTYAGSKDAALSLASRTGSTALHVDAADVSAAMAAIQNAGALDVFVYNAGVIVSGDPLTARPDEIDRLIDINIRSPYHTAVEAVRSMPDGGRVLFIGSVHGDRMPFKGITAYGLSKSALQGMARGFARDFGDRGITVNVIQPGPTDTDMNPATGPLADDMHAQMAIKQHGTSEDVAQLTLYLAGPYASGITGAMHTIDGGFGA
jgi:cyclic-di-GMP-binding biofilm dispersal mediator protein